MTPEECLENACEAVPGLVQGALALLPEGLLIGGVGEGGAFDREPLVRCAARCLTSSAGRGRLVAPFVEHVVVSTERFVVLLRGRRYPRLALALSCATTTNLAFVLSGARSALTTLEGTLDPELWEE